MINIIYIIIIIILISIIYYAINKDKTIRIQIIPTITILPTTTTTTINGTLEPTTTTTINGTLEPTTTTTILPTTTTINGTLEPTTTTINGTLEPTTTTINGTLEPTTTTTQEPFNPLILEYSLVNTDINNKMIGIPIPKSTIIDEIEIDWGDNTEIEKFNSSSETDYPQHLFSNDIDESIIQIRYGNFTHFGFINDTFINNNIRMPNIDRLIKVTSWGDYKITHFNHAFNGATNLIYVPETIPNDVVSMSFMFYDATNFNSDISRWDTSNVTNMIAMFYYAFNFNRDISSWKTSMVTNMNYMFYNATKFNQDITNWDTSNVISMNSMFDGAIDFNQNIGKWNISKVTNMNAIFSNKLITADIYSQILIGWDTNNAPYGLKFNGATGITVNNERTAYINDINAVDASNSLKSKGWTFNPIPTFIQPFTNNEPMRNIKKIEGYSNSKLLYYAKHIK